MIALLREGAAIARSQPVASSLLVIVSTLSLGGALAVSGHTDAFERDVLAAIESPATRTLIVTVDATTESLSYSVVDSVARLSSVEAVYGLGPATDTYLAGLGTGGIPIAVFPVFGDISSIVDLTDGRWPQEDESIFSASALERVGLEYPQAGLITDSLLYRLREAPTLDTSLVGSYVAYTPNGFLNGAGLRSSGPHDTEVRRLIVTAASFDSVADLRATIPHLAQVNPEIIRFQSTAEFEATALYVQGEVQDFSRRVALGAVAVGAVLTAIVTFAGVHSRRLDFGRRRALGADRPTLALLVLIQVMIPVGIGTLVGLCGGWIFVREASETTANLGYASALVVVAILAAAVACLPTAISTAFRDPVRALRVP